ncbi:MAG: hypothetical protein F9B45_25745 [Phycisphaera sp. RhM]|nr:hypothetical protein [Phycisphaera sp. RhM]
MTIRYVFTEDHRLMITVARNRLTRSAGCGDPGLLSNGVRTKPMGTEVDSLDRDTVNPDKFLCIRLRNEPIKILRVIRRTGPQPAVIGLIAPNQTEALRKTHYD